jgi:hypothetical protein
MHAIVFIFAVVAGLGIFIEQWGREKRRERRKLHYRQDVLPSDEWKRKRYVVLKRDNWTCLRCGGRATQVHHKKYARTNIGREPIEWLESVCDQCHKSSHS